VTDTVLYAAFFDKLVGATSSDGFQHVFFSFLPFILLWW